MKIFGWPRFLGLVLVLVGGVTLLNQLEITQIALGEYIRLLWPVVLVSIGAAVLQRPVSGLVVAVNGGVILVGLPLLALRLSRLWAWVLPWSVRGLQQAMAASGGQSWVDGVQGGHCGT